jgi:hypothetical protein
LGWAAFSRSDPMFVGMDTRSPTRPLHLNLAV